MTTVLDKWTNKVSYNQTVNMLKQFDYYKYAVLQTKELGNVLIVHTNRSGNFMLGTKRVLQLFHKYNCDYTLTCYPAKHYTKRCLIANKLSILFANEDKELIFNPDYHYPDISVGVN